MWLSFSRVHAAFPELLDRVFYTRVNKAPKIPEPVLTGFPLSL